MYGAVLIWNISLAKPWEVSMQYRLMGKKYLRVAMFAFLQSSIHLDVEIEEVVVCRIKAEWLKWTNAMEFRRGKKERE